MELRVATLRTDLQGALSLGPRALALSERGPVLLSAALEAEALVLGALQEAATLSERSPASFTLPLCFRCSTGTEAQLVGRVVYHALALPHVAALFPDASARTLLNRNLRALLRGYAAAGVSLRYFGTEVLALSGHPVALVGYDQNASGAVLIEVLVGLDAPCVVRSAILREPPRALYELLGSEPEAVDLARAASRGVAERLGATVRDISSELSLPTPAVAPSAPVLQPVASLKVPLGLIEATLQPQVRIGGDLLAGRAALRRFEAAAQSRLQAGAVSFGECLDTLAGAPLDGARPADLVRVLELAAAPVD